LAKQRIVYKCSNCGANSIKWSGQCPSCSEWNTLEEKVEEKGGPAAAAKAKDKRPKAVLLSSVISQNLSRIPLPIDKEFERVLGGGIVPGSIILIGGQPGIGKSTLMLQMASRLTSKVLYVSGEESAYQIKMRADRISKSTGNCLILCETQLEHILDAAKEQQPNVLLIDSIQTLKSHASESLPGSVSQIRECTSALQQYAKHTNTPVFVIGHITKDGSLAGPKVLEHIVDVVLQFEGDSNYVYRILRTIKNRFGSTDEIGIYEMESSGLRPVTNPSELFLRQGDAVLSGSAIAATIEGLRPLLVEVQALVSTAIYGTPQRSATGYDLRRMAMLLAVLEKRCGFAFGHNDVFLNLAGGIKINDPSIDLSIVAALISSLEDATIEDGICFCGEVGLSGEIRSVNRLEQRIQEADRMGFKEMYVSKFNIKGIPFEKYNINITPIGKVEDLYELLFANQ